MLGFFLQPDPYGLLLLFWSWLSSWLPWWRQADSIANLGWYRAGVYSSVILSKNSKASFARSSSCLCKKLIFWWERDDDWQPRLLGGLALGRWSLRVLTHLPGFVPPELCLTSPDHQPVDPLEPHFGPVLVPSFLSEFPPIRGQLAATVSPLQLNLICTQTVDQPHRKLYFQPISILVPSFLSQWPNIYQSEAVFA